MHTKLQVQVLALHVYKSMCLDNLLFIKRFQATNTYKYHKQHNCGIELTMHTRLQVQVLGLRPKATCIQEHIS